MYIFVHCIAICIIRQLLCNDGTMAGHAREIQYAREEGGVAEHAHHT